MVNNNNLLTDNFLQSKKEILKNKKLYGFDIETYGNKNKFLMGSIVNETEKYIFWNQNEMINFIFNSHKLRGAYIFATNLGFDFLALFGNNFETLSKFQYIIRGSDFITIKYKYKRNTINFMDTFNFLKFSVENLGKILDIDKLPKPNFLGKKPKNYLEQKILQTYNIRDSYISFKFAEYLQNSFNKLGTNLKYTIASTSLNLFRAKYLKYKIQQPTKEVLKDLYQGYYGGRTEAFYRGKIENNFYYYDINSLYPYVMFENEFPFPNSIQYTENGNIELINKYHGLSYCFVECPENIEIPILPKRFTFDDKTQTTKLLFPIGNFYGWYSHIEIRKAIELGYKINIIKTYYYTQNFNPFKDFVTDLYNKRLEEQKKNNKIHIAIKILLNSLYGKLAQKIEKTEIKFVFNQEDKNKIFEVFKLNDTLIKKGLKPRYKIDTPDKREIKGKKGFISEPRLFYITDLETEVFPKFINPILALYITSYARLEIYKYIEDSIKNNCIPIYTDTDSLITNHKIETSNKLGKMKIEHTIKNGIFVKPKFYFLLDENGKEVYKIKGIFGVKNFEEFKKLLDKQEFTYTKFTKFKESLRRKLNFNEKIEVTKFIDLEDNKRVWDKEFNYNELQKSKPFRIDEIKI